MAVFLSSCRKEELRSELDGHIKAYANAHCFDGVLDGDELYVDCGGSCTVCDQVTPSCTMTNNTMTIDGTVYTLTNVDSTTTTSTGVKVFSASSGSINIQIRILPPYNPYIEYGISTYVNPDNSSDASIYVTNVPGMSSAYPNGGHVYFNDNTGSLVVTTCGNYYWDGWGSSHDIDICMSL